MSEQRSTETRVIDEPGPFIEWLEQIPPDTKFGKACNECPLAKFSGHEVGWLSYGDGWLPDWARIFVADFFKKRGPKTARRALRLMRKAHV